MRRCVRIPQAALRVAEAATLPAAVVSGCCGRLPNVGSDPSDIYDEAQRQGCRRRRPRLARAGTQPRSRICTR